LESIGQTRNKRREENMSSDDSNLYSAGTLVIHPSGMVLAIRKSDGRWGLPFGKINPNEGAIEAAIRETFEETRLHVMDAQPGYQNVPFIENGAYTFLCVPVHGWPKNAEMTEGKRVTDPLFFIPETFPKLVSSKEGEAGWCRPVVLCDTPSTAHFHMYNRRMFEFFNIDWSE
jgi:8-oxo-dGTP pyrophosphatase MutT (NUDIX family)